MATLDCENGRGRDAKVDEVEWSGVDGYMSEVEGELLLLGVVGRGLG